MTRGAPARIAARNGASCGRAVAGAKSVFAVAAPSPGKCLRAAATRVPRQPRTLAALTADNAPAPPGAGHLAKRAGGGAAARGRGTGGRGGGGALGAAVVVRADGGAGGGRHERGAAERAAAPARRGIRREPHPYRRTMLAMAREL